MADYDINLLIKTKGDAKGAKDVANGLKEVDKEAKNVEQSTDKAEKSLENLLKRSKLSLFEDKLSAQKSKVAEMVGSDKFNKGAVANAVLQYQKLDDKVAQLNAEAEKASAKPFGYTAEDSKALAEMSSKLDVLYGKYDAIAKKHAQLVNENAPEEKRLAAWEKLVSVSGQIQREEARITKEVEKREAARARELEQASKAQQVAESTQPVADKLVQRTDTEEVEPTVDTSFDERKMGWLNLQTALLLRVGDAADRAKSAVKGFLDSVGERAKSKIDKFTGGLSNVINSFKRIAFYRFIRTVIKEITEGFREGVNNLYQWSKMLGGEFAKSMDTIATSTLYMKNSLGAMVAPLINALAPAIDFVIDKFVALLNVINQVLALFTGAATWTKAKKYPTQYADAVSSGAGKAADALHKLGLAQIDELTILDKNHGDNGSGGGGGSGLDYGSMFDTEKLGGGIWDKIKEAIDNGDWRGAGRILAERLNEIVAGLDTHKWGQEIGTKINNGLEFAYGFLKFTDFKQIGSKIADFINGGFEKINFDTAGRLVARKVTALWDTIIGFVTRLDWGLVARSIGNYFIGLFSEFSEWMESIDWFDLGQQIQQKIYDAISNVDWVGLADSIVRFFTDNVDAVLKFGMGLVFPINEPKFEDKSHWGWTEWAEHIIGEIAPPASALIGFTIGGVPGALVGLVIGLGLKFALKTDLVGKAEKYGERLNEVVKHQSQRAQTTMDQSGSKMEQNTGRHFNNMQTKISTSLGGTSGIVNSKTGDIGRQISSSWNNIERNTDTSWSGIVRKIGDWIEKAKQKLNFSWKLPEVRLPHIPTPHFSMATGIMGVQYPRFDGWWAEGGFPQEGSLFIANEAGAEMVGSIGGHTAVANNDQIVDAVSQGVYEAVRDAMGNGKQSVNVYLDGKQISGTVVQNINSETRRTGNSPLLSY